MIAVNISNEYLDLEPVICGVAESLGLGWRVVQSNGDPDRDTCHSLWALLSKDSHFLDRPEIRLASRGLRHSRPNILWTDDHNNLFGILKWRENLLPTLALRGKS